MLNNNTFNCPIVPNWTQPSLQSPHISNELLCFIKFTLEVLLKDSILNLLQQKIIEQKALALPYKKQAVETLFCTIINRHLTMKLFSNFHSSQDAELYSRSQQLITL